jgi:predicted O-methyltransferase YrrM
MAEIALDTFFSLFEHPSTTIEYAHVHYTQDITLEVICRLAHSIHPKRILEIGTAYGDTTWRLASVCPYAEVVTCDVDKKTITPGTWQYGQILDLSEIGTAYRNRPESGRITQVIFDPGTFDYTTLGEFQFIFLDGLHTYDGVLHDTLKALALISDGGIIIWDDYQPSEPGVVHLIDRINNRRHVDLAMRPCHNICLIQTTRVCFTFLTPHRKACLQNICEELLSESKKKV